MLNILLFSTSLFFTYYLVAIIQTIFHRWFGHKKRIERIYHNHAIGHHSKYPPKDLISHQWRPSERHVLWYYAIPLVPLLFAIATLANLPVFLGFVAGTILSIGWHIYLHKQYHLQNSVWEKFDWFLQKRALHFQHHKKVKTNYAIVEFWIDDLMGTRFEPVSVSTP
jgi:Fatty acid hydroxylase superfamily